MDFIIGQKGTGKTRALMQRAHDSRGILVVSSEKEKERIIIKSKALGFSIGVATYRQLLTGELRGYGAPIFIDELEYFLLHIDRDIKGFALNTQGEE